MTPESMLEVSRRARLIYSGQEVELAIGKMASAISRRMAGSNPVLLTVMNGAVIFAGRLIPQLQFPLQLDFLHATRYRGATTGGELLWKAKPATTLEGRSVLVLDDILDEGATLAGIVHWCRQQGASEVLTAVLIHKRHGHMLAPISADFVGLEAPDEYLYGYGMDYHGYLRNADGIYAVAEGDR